MRESIMGLGILLLACAAITIPVGILLIIIYAINNNQTLKRVALWLLIIGGVSLLLSVVLCSSTIL